MFLFQGTATPVKLHSWNNYMYSYFVDELYQIDCFSKSFYFYWNWSYLTGASVSHSWLVMVVDVCFSAHFFIPSSPPKYGLNRRRYKALSLLLVKTLWIKLKYSYIKNRKYFSDLNNLLINCKNFQLIAIVLLVIFFFQPSAVTWNLVVHFK